MTVSKEIHVAFKRAGLRVPAGATTEENEGVVQKQKRKSPVQKPKLKGRARRLVLTRIANVAPSKLYTTSFQPPQRAAKIEGLMEVLCAEGIMHPLHAIKNGMLIDGHRRKICAEALGLKTVPVIYHEGTEKDLPRLWATINRGSLPIDGAAWLYMWFHSSPSCSLRSKYPPQEQMKKIRDCWEVFEGKKGIAALVSQGYAPFIGQRTKETFRWIQGYSKSSGLITLQELGAWVLRHGRPTLKGMDFAYRDRGPNFASRVVSAVRRDVDFLVPDLKASRIQVSRSAAFGVETEEVVAPVRKLRAV